jgi:hypothetical protein
MELTRLFIIQRFPWCSTGQLGRRSILGEGGWASRGKYTVTTVQADARSLSLPRRVRCLLVLGVDDPEAAFAWFVLTSFHLAKELALRKGMSDRALLTINKSKHD